MAGGDVVKNQFVGLLVVVKFGLLHRIARIHVIKKFNPLDHPRAAAGVVDIETRNDSLGQHRRIIIPPHV